jgi:hypothetical protein
VDEEDKLGERIVMSGQYREKEDQDQVTVL